jgi:hypothetical protein
MGNEVRMSFGKYRGKPVAEIPESYLKWLASIELREPLKSAVAAALAWKAVPVQKELGVATSTTAVRTDQEGVPTASLGASKGFSGASPHHEAARPKHKTWMPRAGDGYVDQGYAESRRAAQAADGNDIPW